MAQLKDLLVSGPSRLIGDVFANKVQLNSLVARTAAQTTSTIYGQGANGKVLLSNGTNVYWGDASDNWPNGILPVNAGGTGSAQPLTANRLLWTGSDGSAIITSAITADSTGNISTIVSNTSDVTYKVGNSNGTIGLYASSNRGLYDFKTSKWIIYNNTAGVNTYVYNWINKGSATKFIYFNSSGEPTTSSSTIGGTTKPIYISSGEFKTISATVGSENIPVYLNAGTISEINVVAVGSGGTGTDTFAANSILYGNGSSAIQAASNIKADASHLTIGSSTLNTSYNLNVTGIIRLNRNIIRNDSAPGQGEIVLTALGYKTGYPVYTDPTFKTTSNSVGVYNNNNANSPVVTVTRVKYSDAGLADPGTGSEYVLRIRNNGSGATPGIGGFVQAIASRSNAEYIQIFRALIPEGYSVVVASNSMGTSYKDAFITDTAGTGKWEWYARRVICGNSGSFSSGGHVYLSGNAGTSSAPVDWYLSYINLYDLTKAEYDGLKTRYADSLLHKLTFNGQEFNGSTDVEIDTIHVDSGGTNNTQALVNNRMVITKDNNPVANGTRMHSATTIYATDTALAVNKTSITSGYNFEVSGTSLLNGIVAKYDHDFISHGNEFNFIPALSANLDIHINYRGRGAHTNSATVTSYRFHNGTSSWAPLYSAHLYPGVTSTSDSTGYDIGSSNYRWKNLYIRNINAVWDVSVGNDLTVNADASIIGIETVENTTDATVHAISGQTATGALIVKGGVNIAKQLRVADDITLYTNEGNRSIVFGYAANTRSTGTAIGTTVTTGGTNTNTGASWRLTYWGSGSSNTNYFSIQSATSTTGAQQWKHVLRLGMNDLDACFGGTANPLVTYSSSHANQTLGTTSLVWANLYSNQVTIDNIKSLTSGDVLAIKDYNGNSTINIFTTKDNMSIEPYADLKGTLGSANKRWKFIYAESFVPDLEVKFSVTFGTGTTWVDIPLTQEQLAKIPNGTNIIQIYDDTRTSGAQIRYSTYFSGIFSWYNGGTNNTEYSEIPLHGAGHSLSTCQYQVRTVLSPNSSTAPNDPHSNKMYFQMKRSNAASVAATAAQDSTKLTIKIKHIM